MAAVFACAANYLARPSDADIKTAEPSATVSASLTTVIIKDSCDAPRRSPTACKPTGANVALTTAAKGFAGANLTYDVIVTGGTIAGKGKSAAWDLTGVNPGTYMAIVTVTDDAQHTATGSVAVTVASCGCEIPK